MRRNGRFNLALGAALAFLCSCWPGRSRTTTCSWSPTWPSCWRRRELPFPSLADVGLLVAIPPAAAAMLAFPGRSERVALQARSLLDGAVIATSLLYTSWALVLGPVFRAGEGSVLEQAIALAYPAGDVVLATVVFVVVARIRVGGAPVLLLGRGPARPGRGRDHLGRAPAGPGTASAALLPPGPGRGHLGDPPAARGAHRPLPLLGVRGPGAADRGPPADHRARQPGPQPPAGLHGRHPGAPGLPRRAHQPANRALFRERVGHALRRRSQAGTPLALLFIDLDDFKMVNDQLGHAAGDDLLVAVAGRLKTCVRGEDTVARLGGDEFAVTISDATEVDAVLREADVAMYTAKARGKGRHELASSSA